MVANDSSLWFPNRRVGERRRVPSRRSGVDRRHASAPGPAEWRRGERRVLAACSPIGAAGPSGGATPRPSDGRRGARFTWHSGYMLGSGTRRSAASASPHHDLVWSSPTRGTKRKSCCRLEGQGHPQTNESSAVYLALVTLKRLSRMRSTATSCCPVRGALATRRAGQNPWLAALLPFSDAERH